MLDDTSVRIVVGGVGSLSYIACVLAIFLRNPSAYLDVFVGLCERVGFRARATDSPQAAGRQQSRETKEVGELRVQSFLGMSQLWMHVCGARIVFVFATGWIQSLPGRGFPSIIFLVSYLACLVVNLRPGLVNSKTLPFLFHISQGLIICIGLAFAIMDASLLVVHQGPLFLLRLIISLVYPVASSNACMSAVWVVLSTYAHLRTAPVLELDLVVETIVTELFKCGFLMYWLWQLESLQTSQVRSEFKASTYFTAKQTMERLLADMCDAVVELGPQLDIKEACPKLASLLLRHGSTTALRGEQFPQLTFGKEDREHFEEFVVQRTMPVELAESASNTAQASSLYLNLKDANGTPVAVQLFHSCHATPLDEICHIVGVHEVERCNGATDAKDALGEIGDTRGASVGDGADDAISEASIGTSRASCDLNMVLAPVIQEDDLVGPVSLLFDPLSLEILGCTVGLKGLLGPVWFKGPLNDCIVNHADFCAWLHKEVNLFLEDELYGSTTVSEFQICLTPPLCKKQASFEFQADARVLYVEEAAPASQLGVELPPGCVDQHHEMLCLLELKNSQPKFLRSKRKSRKRPSKVETDFGLRKAFL